MQQRSTALLSTASAYVVHGESCTIRAQQLLTARAPCCCRLGFAALLAIEAAKGSPLF